MNGLFARPQGGPDSTRLAACSTIRRPLQLPHTARPLHDSGTRRSNAQSSQRSRKNSVDEQPAAEEAAELAFEEARQARRSGTGENAANARVSREEAVHSGNLPIFFASKLQQRRSVSRDLPNRPPGWFLWKEPVDARVHGACPIVRLRAR